LMMIGDFGITIWACALVAKVVAANAPAVQERKTRRETRSIVIWASLSFRLRMAGFFLELIGRLG
jgi:hypothetical protein